MYRLLLLGVDLMGHIVIYIDKRGEVRKIDVTYLFPIYLGFMLLPSLFMLIVFIVFSASLCPFLPFQLLFGWERLFPLTYGRAFGPKSAASPHVCRPFPFFAQIILYDAIRAKLSNFSDPLFQTPVSSASSISC